MNECVPTVACAAVIAALTEPESTTDAPSHVAVAVDSENAVHADTLKFSVPARPEYNRVPLVLTGLAAMVTTQLGGAWTVILNVVEVCARAPMAVSRIIAASANNRFIFISYGLIVTFP